MLWKSGWKRRSGGFAQQPPVGMWFLNATYNATAASPSFTHGPPPFWFGFVALGSGPSSVDAQVVNTSGIFIEYEDQSIDIDNEFTIVNVNPTNAIDGLLLTDPANPSARSVGVLQPYLPGVTVTVGLVSVYPNPSAPGSVFQVWIDGLPLQNNPYSSLSGPTYVAATRPLTIQGIFNGLVGGTGHLTQSDIQDWFANVKQQQQVVAAPGMTDLWSATAVEPAAPGVLPNGGTGQSLNRAGGGTNTLHQVVFNY